MKEYRALETKTFLAATNDHVMCKATVTGEVVWKTKLEHGGAIVTLLADLDRLYAATSGGVTCVDPASGKVIWSTTIRGLAEPATLALDPRPPGVHLIASCAGMLFGLDADSGALLWEDGLKGMGYHPVCVRVVGGVVAEPRTRQVSSGKSTHTQVLESEQEG
jgi:outer membrane protein assembly factor BamB